MTKTLRDWLPREANDQDFPRLKKLMDLNVVYETSCVGEDVFYRWPGSHKNVNSWCVLEDGSAVAWNENPAVGWSFPKLSVKLVREDVVEIHIRVAKGTPEERTVYADKHGIQITNYAPYAGKFTRSQSGLVVDTQKTLGEVSVVVVPGVTRWTMQEKNSRYARVVAEQKVPA
jgi:hypothetical protein